jgi:exopolyphosphatase / guanosine-5'-triphosphate,3'-diphosphate pyrophosphatase
MAAIIPRWEWRTFGAGLRAAEDAFAALTPGPVEESDELYLLSAADSNVKVRYDLLDIKLLREVNADGLERWEPVMKQGFPLPAAEVPRVFDALGVAPPPLTREAYTLGQLLSELVEPSGGARAVRVHKRRVRYTLGGCMADIADLQVDGRAARTIAIESEDAAPSPRPSARSAWTATSTPAIRGGWRRWWTPRPFATR